MKQRIGKYILVLWGALVILIPSQAREDSFTRQIPRPPQKAVGQKEVRPLRIGKVTNPQLLGIIWKAARDYGLPVSLVAAIIKAESGFNPFAVSPKGAVGLMQLMPETSRSLGVSRPHDPIANIYGGVRYFRGLLNRYNGNLYLALAAYNAGPGAVERHGLRIPPYRETLSYVPRVLNYYKRFNSVWAVD